MYVSPKPIHKGIFQQFVNCISLICYLLGVVFGISLFTFHPNLTQTPSHTVRISSSYETVSVPTDLM